VSNPDWTGPYWQDDASAGRRGEPDDQSAWDDAGFWRTDDGRPARADGWQSANGSDRSRGSRRATGSRRDDHANGNGYPDERPRRATDAGAGTRSARANGAGRFGASANDLKNRFRGSLPDRGRGQVVDDATDQNFWGDSMGRADRAPDRAPGGSPGRRHAAGPRGAGDGADRTGDGSQGGRENGAGGNGYRGARRANGNGNGAYRNGNGGYQNGGYENGNGARGYADGGQPGGGRTALRDRIQDGVRSRTGITQRGPGGPGGRGGGGGWDDDGPGGGQPGGRWQRFTRYVRSGKWWRHWTWKKVLGLIGAGIAACVLIGALAIFIVYQQTPIPSVSEETANWASSTVYFAGGQQMGVFDTFNGSTIDRQILTQSQIPPIMNDAMIAAEDRNFMHEGGISVTGLVRSAYDDLFGSGNLQGGSTITMQYAKNYYAGVNTGQNAGTKLKEIFIAMKLAHKRSKLWILTSYLNTVPFGPTTDGVGAAAQNYFNVNLAVGGKQNQLTFEQAAVLAAMPNSPGFLSPDPNAGAGYAALQQRFHYVLNNMARDGAITQQQADTAKFPAYNPPKQTGYTGVNGYLMTMVKQQLEAPKSMGGLGLTEQQIATGGYRIKTTFSMPRIRALAKAVAQEKGVLRQQAALGAGSTLHNYDHFGAALIDPKTGAITAIYGGPGFLTNAKQCNRVDCEINTAEVPQEVGSSFKPYVLATAVNENMNVFTSKLNGIVPMYIPTKSATGDIKAMELALSVTGPVPGATSITPTSFDGPNGTYYSKIKAGCDSASVCTALAVNVATATSSDPAFMDLAHRDGITAVINMAGAMGVGGNPFLYPTGCQAADKAGVTYAQVLQHCNDFNGQNGIQTQYSPTHGLYSKAALLNGSPGSPQVALGQAPLTPIEQASMIATLADGGIWHMPHVIASITSATHQAPKAVVATRQVLSAAGAADVDWALSFDNNMAGATAMGTVTYHPGGIIAKTGTIGNGDTTFDAWFVGAVPKQQAMAVDLYANDPGIEKEVLNELPYTPSGMRGSLGGAWPASIWNAFFTNEFPTTSYQQVDQVFPTTNGYPFVAWIQAKPVKPKLQFCKFGQTQNCKPVKCHGGRFFGQPCPGTNPTPTPTCSFQGQQNCTNPTPNPTQTCFPPGGQCNQSPSPTPSPSPSPSCTLPGPCNTLPAGTAGDKARTTAAQLTAGGSVAARTIGLYQTSLAKIERLVLLT
jgi:membrane peptidoglycan carboxypeptidase